MYFLICRQMGDVLGIPPQRQPLFDASAAADIPGRARVSGRGFFSRFRYKTPGPGGGRPQFDAEFQVSGTPFSGASSLDTVASAG